MTHDEMRHAIATYHAPDAKADRMVYSVWEDGEITLEKGGELFGLRTLHMIAPGDPAKAWPKELFPVQNAQHGRIFAASSDAANAFANLILGA